MTRRAAGLLALMATGALTTGGCDGEEDAAEVAVEQAAPPSRFAGTGPADDRTVVHLPDSIRAGVREGMIRMLESLHESASALARGDTAAARDAAAVSGMGGAGMMPASVRQTAPPEFLALGMRTHQAFDRLAAAASAGATGDSLAARIAGVTDACMSCHTSFRVETAPPGGPPR